MGTPPVGHNILDLKAEATRLTELRKVDIVDFYKGEFLFTEPGSIKAFRVVRRNDDMNPHNFDNLGVAYFDAAGTDGPFAVDGTTNQQGLTRWMAGFPTPDTNFKQDWPTDGRAEVEFLVPRLGSDGQLHDVWVNAANGQINTALYFLVDGQVAA